MIRPAKFWDERDIRMILSRRLVAVNPTKNTVITDDGDEIGYEKLIWATGASPRKLALPGFDLGGIHYVRTRAHVDAMIADNDSVQQAAVIGGGYIGLEAAAVLRKLDKEVILIETLDRVLARVAGCSPTPERPAASQ